MKEFPIGTPVMLDCAINKKDTSRIRERVVYSDISLKPALNDKGDDNGPIGTRRSTGAYNTRKHKHTVDLLFSYILCVLI